MTPCRGILVVEPSVLCLGKGVKGGGRDEQAYNDGLGPVRDVK